MEFGKVEDWNSIDFALPPEPAWNAAVLEGGAISTQDVKVYIGCPRYSVKEWKGRVFPEKAPQRKFLEWYCKQFNALEANQTGYRALTPNTAERWLERATGDFKFCPKLPRSLTHYGRLELNARIFDHLDACTLLGRHLGPNHLQLSPKFGPDRLPEILNLLNEWPRDIPFALELRHPDWFSGSPAFEHVLEAMAAKQQPMIITDTPGRRDVLHGYLTAPRTFIRFKAHGEHPSDAQRIAAWSARIGQWLKLGLRELYFIVHSPGEQRAPEVCNLVSEQLQRDHGLQHKKWAPAESSQESLF